MGFEHGIRPGNKNQRFLLLHSTALANTVDMKEDYFVFEGVIGSGVKLSSAMIKSYVRLKQARSLRSLVAKFRFCGYWRA